MPLPLSRWSLSLRGRGLDLSLALVIGRGDAGEGVGFLFLHEPIVSIQCPGGHGSRMGFPGLGTHLEILVRGLLPLLVHGVWSGLSKHAHCDKDRQTGKDADSDAESDLLALIRGRQGTGAVRTERDVVSYEAF